MALSSGSLECRGSEITHHRLGLVKWQLRSPRQSGGRRLRLLVRRMSS